MSEASSKVSVVMPSVAEDKIITARAKSDPDALPLSAKQLSEMAPLKKMIGRPKSDRKKILLSVRYSPEVIAFFKSTGEGWQSRMDGVLREYVQKRSGTSD